MTEPIKVGVGVSSGPVVMGNMGCDARMVHTVIGPTVNLAARLCSAALGGEVVIQHSLIQEAREEIPELTASLQREEALQVKGFSSMIKVRRAFLEELPDT